MIFGGEKVSDGYVVMKIDSRPPVRFYQKSDWASKSLCLLAQKVG